ncbi:hypothetical protein OFC55_41680, partial [Escherichia coli]|nr:hypothetical protein [Escherichia coli]
MTGIVFGVGFGSVAATVSGLVADLGSTLICGFGCSVTRCAGVALFVGFGCFNLASCAFIIATACAV